MTNANHRAIPTATDVRSGEVLLARQHAGQHVEHHVRIEAQGHYYPDGRDAFGGVIERWKGDHYRAVLRTWDRSQAPRDEHETVTTSEWGSYDDAVTWIIAHGFGIFGFAPLR